MTSAETVRESGARTEIVRAALLQRGVVVIDDETGARSMVDDHQENHSNQGDTITTWFTNKTAQSWYLDMPVTVLAESLPASYWLAKYEWLKNQVAEQVATLVSELEHRAARLAADKTEPPVVRAAAGFEAHRNAERIQGSLGVQ